MQKVDIWFGDSWTIGSELSTDATPLEHAERKHYFKQNKHRFPHVALAQNPLASYPMLVSKSRGAKYLNFASAGGSYQFSYFQMCNWWSTKQYENNTEYTFWLQTMPSTRSFGINNNFEWQHFIGIDNSFNNTKTNPAFSSYEAQSTINSIYTFCKMLNIDLKIVPLWTGHNALSEMNIVPDHVWIAPPDKNMLSDIFGSNIFADGGIDTKDLTVDEIKRIICEYDYIQPNLCHPNKQAHTVIAEYIIKNI